LNGTNIFLKGSHDYWLKGTKFHEIWEGRIEKQYVVVCHYAMRTWARSHYNSWQLYGHCLDLSTEILTEDGWKYRDALSANDKVVTLNTKTMLFEYSKINEVVDYVNYNGRVVSYESKGIDIRVTENHTMVDFSHFMNKTRNFFAKDLVVREKRSFIKAGILKRNWFNISDNMIKLLVWIAADGNICNSDLCRIRVFKQRKKSRIRLLLDTLLISYKEHPQKDGSISFDFNLPSYLKSWRFKPIDDRIKEFNRDQLKILLEEYTHTDGSKNSSVIIIYTSKKAEADLIQHACVINGFMCNINTREGHGFSNNISYALFITDRTMRWHTGLKRKVKISCVENEHFWCVNTNNGIIMIRRNGKPLVIGNSHGKLPPIGKQWDIGVDNNDFYPVSFEKLKEIMSKRPDNVNLIKKS
jgi:hypothetical protein